MFSFPYPFLVVRLWLLTTHASALSSLDRESFFIFCQICNHLSTSRGLIVGERGETRVAEAVLRKIAGAAGSVSNKLKDFWAQDSEVIARAAVKAGLEGLKEAGGEEKVKILGQADIVRLGRTEWNL